jgi:transcriptional regulator with AAA-type ATPase domain/tetratricopeptide (TPR) repeat protein
VTAQSLLGTSPAMSAVRDEISRLLARPAAGSRRFPPILIGGETGTGKGLLAHLIHETGPRADAAFVDVNCAAIPDTLLEAELFGFERGAFTDAKQAKPGLLQLAHRGTIFLDEIGLMPEPLQVKLLKALEDRAVRRLGGTRAEPADAWVVAATSEDLTAAIRSRRFRDDLFHRLAVVTLHLPALRERGRDVLLLARHYLDRACTDYGLAHKHLTSDAEAAMLAYPWPGNVRELANLMERVALLSDAEQITAAVLRLPHEPRIATPTSRAGETVNDQMDALEHARIEEALRADGWNISRAAARLGLPRNTLRYRMERHGLAGGEGVTKRQRSKSTPPVESTPAVRWQRARITLLHARVPTSNAAPETEHERMRLLDEVATKVSAFGGRVIDIAASSVDAAFGLDIAEDAAQHAAHAAFAVQRSIGSSRSSSSSRVQVALHTEEVLVGRLDERVELDADARRTIHDVVDRLLAAAPGEPIVASAASRHFLGRRFQVEPVATSTAQHTWRVTGLATAPDDAAPFVARAREIALLEDLLAQAERGHGQAVLIGGDPGIGKTRLLHEFRRRTIDRAAWLRGSAVSFGGAWPLHPLIDLLKHAFSIQAGDSNETIGERIDRATGSLGASLQPSVPFLRSLLSVDAQDPAIAQLDPKLRRAGIFEAVAQFLHASSHARPTIVVLEDLHWMDQATGEFLAMMGASLTSGGILLCATHRTGYAQPIASGVFGTQVTLARISRSEASAMACSRLGAASLSGELQQLVDEKTEGNPFFVEEVLRSLQERGLLERRGDEVGLARPTAKVDVPDSVQDVLLGRLQRLDMASRDLLMTAAVIGREFPRRVLERVVDAGTALEDRLSALRSVELIQNARVWPEVVYAFKHALTHEVTYQALPETERDAQHARIGEAIETVYADRLSEQYGVLTHHFTRARRWDKSLSYALAAAQQAERTFATREALAHYDAALAAARHLGGGAGDPATLIAIHEAKARLYYVTSEFEQSEAEGERILPLARLTGNRVKEAEALATIAWAAMWSRRDLDAAIRASREAIAVAEPIGALAVQARAHLTIGFIRGVTGVTDESHTEVDKAVAISAAAGDRVYRSISLTIGGLLRNWTGNFDEAARMQAEGLALARETGVLVPLLFNCFMRGMTLTGKGDYDEAFASFNEGLSLAERVGDEAIHHRLLNCLGWLYADLGDLDQAEALNAVSAQIGRRRSDPGTQPNAELNLAEVFRTRGDLGRATDQYDAVFRYWKNPSASLWMRYRYSIRMFVGMGELAVAQRDLGTARAHNASCLDLATRSGSRKNLVKGWRLAGEIARAERDWDAAVGHLRTSRDLAASVGNPVQRWKSELALGRCLQDAGRVDDAREAFQRAFAVMQRVRERLRDDRLRQAFEKNPDLAAVTTLVMET